LVNNVVVDQANIAWGGHTCAYTTKVVLEKGMSNYKALNYRYLVKSSWIKYVPGSSRVPRGCATVGGKWRCNTRGSVPMQ